MYNYIGLVCVLACLFLVYTIEYFLHVLELMTWLCDTVVVIQILSSNRCFRHAHTNLHKTDDADADSKGKRIV